MTLQDLADSTPAADLLTAIEEHCQRRPLKVQQVVIVDIETTRETITGRLVRRPK